SASIEAFERWEAKADKMLDVAMAKAELAEDAGVDTPEDLVKKYSKGSTVEIDAEIAKMKEEMGL
ncbi:MAG: PspA/IM30 family protein, partial [Firmicutes bacterium]|nr:PspA/IM30 family protein [Bacillota bacterium]